MITRSGRSHLIPPYRLEAIWREGEGRDQLFLLVLLILPRPRALDKVFGGDEILKIHSVVQTHLRYEIGFSPFHTVDSTTFSRLEWVEKQLRRSSSREGRARSRSRNQSARPCSRYFTPDWIILFLSPSTSPYACSVSGHQTRNSNCYTSPKLLFSSATHTLGLLRVCFNSSDYLWKTKAQRRSSIISSHTMKLYNPGFHPKIGIAG